MHCFFSILGVLSNLFRVFSAREGPRYKDRPRPHQLLVWQISWELFFRAFLANSELFLLYRPEMPGKPQVLKAVSINYFFKNCFKSYFYFFLNLLCIDLDKNLYVQDIFKTTWIHYFLNLNITDIFDGRDTFALKYFKWWKDNIVS